MTRPRCFIAMPLTTPESAVDRYGGDHEHFIHVLEHLFIPAVEKAGYEPVRPVMVGTDLIHAEIVRNLEQADMVLCDISMHNPNVFFELGIRTALDLPVALVRDSLTDRLPFDTSILNTHRYDASISVWNLESNIDQVANHLQVVASRSQGENPLWKYFGLSKRAQPEDSVAAGDASEAKMDALLIAVRDLQASVRSEGERLHHDSVSSQWTHVKSFGRLTPPDDWEERTLLTALPTNTQGGQMPDGLEASTENLLLALSKIAEEINARLWVSSISADMIVLDARPFGIVDSIWSRMRQRANEDGFELKLIDDEREWGAD